MKNNHLGGVGGLNQGGLQIDSEPSQVSKIIFVNDMKSLRTAKISKDEPSQIALPRDFNADLTANLIEESLVNVLDHPDATKSKPRLPSEEKAENNKFLHLSPDSGAQGDKIIIDTGVFGHESREEKKNDEEDGEELETRTILPFLRDPNNRPSVFKILKDASGKDLSRFCVPVYFNEPVSMV